MTAWQQLDLFAEGTTDARVQWAARFERAPWVAPYDCSGGLRKGESVLGWMCPTCRRIEINSFTLNVNHGYDPQIPGRQPYDGWGTPCSRERLLASQERARAAKAERGAA